MLAVARLSSSESCFMQLKLAIFKKNRYPVSQRNCHFSRRAKSFPKKMFRALKQGKKKNIHSIFSGSEASRVKTLSGPMVYTLLPCFPWGIVHTIASFARRPWGRATVRGRRGATVAVYALFSLARARFPL